MKIISDEKWAAIHFDKLVKKYGGGYVGILKKRVIARGKTPLDIIKKSGLKNPEKIYLFKVPTKRELVCLL